MNLQTFYRIKIGITFFIFLLSSCSSLKFEDSCFEELRHKETKYLIITADDFGASENINEGTRKGIKNGVINSVAAMVTFPNAPQSIISLHKEFPETEIGLHLSVTSGHPVSKPSAIPTLVDEQGNFFTIDQIIVHLDKIDPWDLEKELRAQIDLFKSLNIPISCLSSQHNILGIYTPFFDVVLSLAKEYDIPMRSTIPCSMAQKEFAHSKTKKRALDLAGLLVRKDMSAAIAFGKYGTLKEMETNQKKMDNLKIVHPDYLIDSFWGDPSPENFHSILKNMPPGISELVFHLGTNETKNTPPNGIDGNYYLMREFELFCVTSNEIPRWMKDFNIETYSFKDLQNNISQKQ